MQKKSNFKIGIDARELHKDMITGICRFLKNFLDNIENTNKFYLCIDKNTYIDNYKDKFTILKANSLFTIYYDFFSLKELIAKNNIDIFFSPYYKMPLFSNIKRIITIHDLHFLKPMLRYGINRFKPFIRYLKILIKYSDKIITVSEFSKREIIKNFSVKEDKIKVIYNAVGNIFKKLPENNKDKLIKNYFIDYPYILYVGNMLPHKNIKGLILAFSLLTEKIRKGYKLIIVAHKTKHFKELMCLVRLCKLEDSVIFLDFLSDEDLVLFYNFAEVFVFPSFYEGFGLPPIEAIACGGVVIASYTASLREILEDCALYINPYDVKDIAEKINYLINDVKLKKELQEKGLKLIKKYSPKIFASNLLKEIEDTI